MTALNDKVGLQLSKSRRVVFDVDLWCKIPCWRRSSRSNHSVSGILCMWLEGWLLPHLGLGVVHSIWRRIRRHRSLARLSVVRVRREDCLLSMVCFSVGLVVVELDWSGSLALSHGIRSLHC